MKDNADPRCLFLYEMNGELYTSAELKKLLNIANISEHYAKRYGIRKVYEKVWRCYIDGELRGEATNHEKLGKLVGYTKATLSYTHCLKRPANGAYVDYYWRKIDG